MREAPHLGKFAVEVGNPALIINNQDAVGGGFQGGVQHGKGVGELRGSFSDLAFNVRVNLFQVRTARGDLERIPQALPYGNEQEGVFEEDPACVFKPPPGAYGQHAINRLRPVNPAHEMVNRHNHGRRDKDPPVAIKGQKRQ